MMLVHRLLFAVCSALLSRPAVAAVAAPSQSVLDATRRVEKDAHETNSLMRKKGAKVDSKEAESQISHGQLMRNAVAVSSNGEVGQVQVQISTSDEHEQNGLSADGSLHAGARMGLVEKVQISIGDGGARGTVVSFEHAGRTLQYQLKNHNVYTADAKVSDHTEAGEVFYSSQSPHLFRSVEKGKFAHVSLKNDGSITGLFEDGAHVFKFQKQTKQIGRHTPSASLLEASVSVNGMAHIVHRHSFADIVRTVLGRSGADTGRQQRQGGKSRRRRRRKGEKKDEEQTDEISEPPEVNQEPFEVAAAMAPDATDETETASQGAATVAPDTTDEPEKKAKDGADTLGKLLGLQDFFAKGPLEEEWKGTAWWGLAGEEQCYPGDDKVHELVIGVAADQPATCRWHVWTLLDCKKDLQGKLLHDYHKIAKQGMEDVVLQAAFVFYKQLHVNLKIGSLKTHTDAKGAPQYVDGCPGKGSALMDKKDKLFDAAVREEYAFQGLWHMFTGCYSTDGEMGRAFDPGVCIPFASDENGAAYGGNTGFTVLSDASDFDVTWLTFAHEIGHNFGGDHTFQDGETKTGGILDYGTNVKLDGAYQFNTKYSKDIMCGTIRKYPLKKGCHGKFYPVDNFEDEVFVMQGGALLHSVPSALVSAIAFFSFSAVRA